MFATLKAALLFSLAFPLPTTFGGSTQFVLYS
jgi:hypothetical protein